MGREAAERIFGRTTGYVKANADIDESVRHNLRVLLLDHRAMSSQNIHMSLQCRHKSGSTASSTARARRLAQLTETLFVSDRWPEEQAQNHLSHVARSELLGYEARPTLPTATSIAGAGKRVGPGGTMRAELESPWSPSSTYGCIVRAHEPMATATADASAPPGSAAVATEAAYEADSLAVAQDGDRMWPPRAISNSEDAASVSVMLDALCQAMDSVPKRIRRTNGAGVYACACQKTLADVGVAGTRNMLGLGVAVMVRNPLAVHSARKHAMHCAMAAHARGCDKLGEQLEHLGELLTEFIR